MTIADSIDRALEASVIGSFSRIGYSTRKRLLKWPELDLEKLRGQVVVITGASSGLGFYFAEVCVKAGATVHLLVRNVAKTEKACARWSGQYPQGKWMIHHVDTSDFSLIRSFASDLAPIDSIDLLVHNAGTITKELTLNSDGVEITAASQLVGPYLLTRLLQPKLEIGRARVLWMASGGLYSEPLDLSWLESPADSYTGVSAYAKVKRAQLSLVAQLAPEFAERGISMNVLHPGWVDTPGLRESLPLFGAIMRPLLRNELQGLDTALWLVTTHDQVPCGKFWFDRRERSFYRTKQSRISDDLTSREDLLHWCEAMSRKYR